MTYTIEQVKRIGKQLSMVTGFSQAEAESFLMARNALPELITELEARDREIERLKSEGACAGERATVVAKLLDEERLKTARECVEIAESHEECLSEIAEDIREKFGL